LPEAFAAIVRNVYPARFLGKAVCRCGIFSTALR
jgi:hypothetical protein